MELGYRKVRLATDAKGKITYRKSSFPEHDHIHVDWIQVGRAILVLVKTPETDEIVIAKELDLLARFLHLNIFSRQGMNTENLKLRQLCELIWLRHRRST